MRFRKQRDACAFLESILELAQGKLTLSSHPLFGIRERTLPFMTENDLKRTKSFGAFEPLDQKYISLRFNYYLKFNVKENQGHCS